MFAIIILLTSTLLQEGSDTLGKHAVKQRLQTVYSLAFLGVFWTLAFLIILVIFGSDFRVMAASMPTLICRIILETTLAFVGAKAIIRADRSTVGFLRLLTIPLLLGVDLVLGYHLTLGQFLGLGLMFGGLFAAFYRNPNGKKGAWLVICGAIISVATASLYKWDITHYNSVAGDQIVVFSCLLVFFFIQSVRNDGSPFALLVRPRSGTQSLASGLSSAIESFAYGFAPASVVIALKRSFALIWSIVFGHAYFAEKDLKKKIFASIVLILGLCLLAAPYLKVPAELLRP